MRERAKAFFEDLQDRICAEIERLDGKQKFREDRWEYAPSGEASLRSGGGGGITRVIAEGAVFEKGGVNTSAVAGRLPEKMAQRMKVGEGDFFACGISLVLHPRSPHVPTVHMNMRYLEVQPDDGSPLDGWFGGGADLTPYYLNRDDAKHFHQALKQACDAHDPEHYPRFKQWCDEYFVVKHRGEARGVGGIFFDYLRGNLEGDFPFVQDAGNAFLAAYPPIVERRMHDAYDDAQRQWQLVRRGRYVEFNLVYDRGTLFGLETKGRIESILMSLPPHVSWVYDHQPEPGSPEAELVAVLREPVAWV
ncbi:coproporphyrinogen III oxidase [Acidobacteria bacterium Mor1]|nr:coproporphyrinogen III oxidase [Acidobacteria bacterium Mor1]